MVALSRVRGLKPKLLKAYGPLSGRTLTSAWIETDVLDPDEARAIVALSRVRGLKLYGMAGINSDDIVALSRVRGLKLTGWPPIGTRTGRTLTSAWIET